MILKSTRVIVLIVGLTLSADRRTFAADSDDKPTTTRQTRRSAAPPKTPVRNQKAEADAPRLLTSENSNTGKLSHGSSNAGSASDFASMREDLQHLQAEVDRLKAQPRDASLGKQSEERSAVRGEFFPRLKPTGGASLMDDRDAVTTDPGVTDLGNLFDDDPAPLSNPYDAIQLIQQLDEDRSPSAFGAVPGQHLRPRRTNELGSIGLPALPEYKPNMPALKRKVEAEFGDGLTVKTDDDYFSLTFHNLTQVDGRFFDPSGDPLHDNFIIPRQRWYVIGNISPNVRYYTVINRGYGTLDVLDAWVDLNFGGIDRDKLEIRVGRMKTPYTYEYIKISETDLIAPERSVFVGNLAPNREIGVMAHGRLLNQRLEYAVGLFNGPRRSFEGFNNGKDLFTFINSKPFLDGDSELLKQLNVGGSWNWGNEHNPAQPFDLRTANDQSTSPAAGNVSPTFFRLADNVFEDGTRMQWSGDVAWYYKSMGILAGYQGGFQDYALTIGVLPSVQQLRLGQQEFAGVIGGNRTRVPMSGYSIAAFYFLTGEEITRRVDLLEPRKQFASSALSEGNIGAIELFSRYAFMSLGGDVFTAGLADPTISSNRATVIDNGVNWYLNHYVKLTFDWQYSAYGSPVLLTPAGRNTSFNNLFWLRTQVFF